MQKQADDLERGITEIQKVHAEIVSDLAKRGILIKVPGNAVSVEQGDEGL